MKSNIRWWLSVIVMLLVGTAYSYQWEHYGEWVDVTNSPALVNEAKEAAIADQRPMLVLYTRSGTDCSHCKALWQGALCDGGSKCIGSSCPLYKKHPWASYAKEKKIILLYINLSQIQDWFTYLKKQHPMTYTGAYPVYAIFHVKDNADCENENKQFILNTSRVDCIGASYYSTGSRINGVKMENSFESFKELYESYFADGKETYGLTLDPEGGAGDEEIDGVEQLTMVDFTKNTTVAATLSSDKTSAWYNFTAVKNETYNFKFKKTSGSSTVKVGIYENTGTADQPDYDKKTPLLDPQDVTFGETVSWKATKAGTMLVKVYSEATSPNVKFTMDYLLLPNGNHLLNPDRAASNGNWGSTYGTRRPAVIAFIDNDIWNDDTLALAKAVQTNAFTSAYSGATWYVLTEAQGTLAPTTTPELIYLIKKNNQDTEMGRVSGDDAMDVQRFAQYKELEADDYEPENNEYATTDGVLNVGTLSGVKLGGVDAVDWYEFNSTADNQKWTFTVGGNNASDISMAITDANGNAVDAAVEGSAISYTVAKSGTKMYVKLEAGTASLFDYTLASEIKVANYTVQFGASDYTVMADADSLEIPIVLNKLNYKAGAITVSVNLDSSTAFNQEVFFPKGNFITYSTSISWTAKENTNNNAYPKTKTVKVMLGETEKEDWWAPGEKEKTVTVTLSADTDGVELAAENTTATIHIRNVNIPTFVGENGDGSTTVSYETFTAAQPDESQAKTVENCISVPEAYAGNEIFWELIDGEVPEGVDIDIRQHAEGERSYDVVVSGTAKEATETSATLLFFMRKEAGKKQIIRGDEFTVTFTIEEKRMVNGATRGGWNLMAIPWDMKINEESEMEFQTTNAGNIYTSDGNSYVKNDGSLKKGSAYWFFVKEGGQNPLTGIKDTSVDEAKMIEEALQGMGGKWYFGADPGVENCEARWIWDAKEKKFIPMEDKTVGEAGWWFIKKAE